MRILFLTDNFPPEYNAPATRTFEHCREWVKQGAEVTVITCFPNFPKGELFEGYKNKWKQVEYIEGIRVIRVWSYISANQGVFKRTVDFLSYAVTSFLAGLWLKCDVIIATSPQFFTAVSGCALSVFKRKPWVMEVRDIWPESIKAVEAVNANWIISVLEKIEIFLYKKASRIIVVTDSFLLNLKSKGVNTEKIFVIKNGVDLSIFQPQPKNFNLVQKLQLDGKLVFGYVGTHGLAHSLDFIIRAIHKLKDASLHFVFIGDGAEKKKIMKLAEELRLSNVTFIDPVKKTDIGTYLSILDVALVPLKKSTTFESVIPSKVFESVAMNIPILLGVDGETRSIIENYNAGIYFEPENEKEFIEKTTQIAAKIRTDKNYFAAGCQKMANDFNRKNLAAKMLNVLSGIK
jgi:glycosyltransferase involved in cell wall biosynthesis